MLRYSPPLTLEHALPKGSACGDIVDLFARAGQGMIKSTVMHPEAYKSDPEIWSETYVHLSEYFMGLTCHR